MSATTLHTTPPPPRPDRQNQHRDRILKKMADIQLWASTPWRSPHLQGKPLEEEIEDDHFRSENWKYYTQFMCNENGRMEKLDRNEWCKKVRGDIFIYKSCVCDWDGSNYICSLSLTETDRVELIRCLKDYVEQHPAFCEG